MRAGTCLLQYLNTVEAALPRIVIYVYRLLAGTFSSYKVFAALSVEMDAHWAWQRGKRVTVKAEEWAMTHQRGRR